MNTVYNHILQQAFSVKAFSTNFKPVKINKTTSLGGHNTAACCIVFFGRSGSHRHCNFSFKHLKSSLRVLLTADDLNLFTMSVLIFIVNTSVKLYYCSIASKSIVFVQCISVCCQLSSTGNGMVTLLSENKKKIIIKDI